MSMSPIGTTASEASACRARRSTAYQAARDAHADSGELAWLVIRHRMDHQLTQQELADRVGTSSSQISRIESGRHMLSIATLRRIADVLGYDVVIRFEPKPPHEAKVIDEEREAVPMESGPRWL